MAPTLAQLQGMKRAELQALCKVGLQTYYHVFKLGLNVWTCRRTARRRTERRTRSLNCWPLASDCAQSCTFCQTSLSTLTPIFCSTEASVAPEEAPAAPVNKASSKTKKASAVATKPKTKKAAPAAPVVEDQSEEADEEEDEMRLGAPEPVKAPVVKSEAVKASKPKVAVAAPAVESTPASSSSEPRGTFSCPSHPPAADRLASSQSTRPRPRPKPRSRPFSPPSRTFSQNSRLLDLPLVSSRRPSPACLPLPRPTAPRSRRRMCSPLSSPRSTSTARR